jgi:hypothetical protein
MGVSRNLSIGPFLLEKSLPFGPVRCILCRGDDRESMETFDRQKLHIFGFLGGRGGLKRPTF